MGRALVVASVIGMICGCSSGGAGGTATREADASDAGAGRVPDGALAPLTDAQPPPPPTLESPSTCRDPAIQDAVIAMMRDGITDNGVPGGAIAIVCDGAIARAEGIGTVSAGGAPVDARTRFQLASISKSLTAAAIVGLDEDGVIDLDAPIGAHVPYANTRMPYDRDATLAELLSHSAGYPTDIPDADYSSEELEGFFRNNGSALLWSPPGEVFNYSNVGYALAGLAAEAASGRPFPELLDERLFARAGMSATFDAARVLAEGNYATGHANTTSTTYGPTDLYYASPMYGPMGGAWSSVEDLARFGMLLMGTVTGVLSPAALERMRTPLTPTPWPGVSYALGLLVEDGSVPRIGHDGSVGGFLSAFAVLPTLGVGVFALVNADWWYPGEAVSAGTEMLGGFVPSSVAPVPIGEEALVGSYRDEVVVGRVTIERSAGGLEIVFPDRGGRRSALTELYPGTYSFEDPIWMEESFASAWPPGAASPRYLVTPGFVARR